jgi:adapter protein MecA 1/2
MERLSQDKIRIFLTFDDLSERGIQKEDMWREIPKVHELFSEMMDQAYNELGFDVTGPLAVEVFALPAQGMVVIVTKGSSATSIDDEEDDIYELEVTLEQSELISYAFSDFEHLVMAAKAVRRLVDGGVLYHYHSQYVLVIDPEYLDDQDLQLVVAILSEYGEAASVTDAVLGEYGKMIIADRAVEVICRHF